MNNFSVIFLTLTVVLLCFQPCLPAMAQNAVSGEEEIRELLDTRDQQIKAIVGQKDTVASEEQREQLKSIINNIIDFQSMASYALGETWNELDAVSREEFLLYFTAVVREQSLSRLDIYRAEVSYESINVQDQSANVHTTAEYENVRVSVGYEMEFQDNHWVITDLILDEVSTAEMYRTQFRDIIRRHGFEALLQSLETRAARIT